MIFWILPMLLSVFLVGAGMLVHGQADAVLPPAAQTSAIAMGQSFVAYRNAVVAYVTQNPTFTGSVPAGSLALPGGMPLPPGAGNQVTATPSGAGRIITSWAALPPSAAIYYTVKGMDGDETLGLAPIGTQWESPVYGNMGSLPVQVPNGDAVSVVQIGN